MDSSISPASAGLNEVVDLVTLHALLSIGWASSFQMTGTAISANLVHWHFSMCLWFFHIVSFLLLLFLFCENPLFHLDWWLL